MKKLISGIMCICLSLIVGCSNPASIIKNAVDSKPSIIKSEDGVFQVIVPGGWKATTKGELNKIASLEVANKLQSKFFMTIMQKKQDFNSDFAEYTNLVTQNAGKNYNTTLNDPVKTTVGSYNAYVNEFDTTSGKLVFHIWLYTVETDNYYGQIYCWTLKNKAEAEKTELTTIINTFHEIVTPK